MTHLGLENFPCTANSWHTLDCKGNSQSHVICISQSVWSCCNSKIASTTACTNQPTNCDCGNWIPLKMRPQIGAPASNCLTCGLYSNDSRGECIWCVHRREDCIYT